MDAEVVHLDGAVESSVRLGVADLIADVVETGSTLKAAGLEVFGEPLAKSEAVLITRPDVVDDPALATLVKRLEGVQVARKYVIVDYNVRESALMRRSLLRLALTLRLFLHCRILRGERFA